jgi:hypothetical protein
MRRLRNLGNLEWNVSKISSETMEIKYGQTS